MMIKSFVLSILIIPLLLTGCSESATTEAPPAIEEISDYNEPTEASNYDETAEEAETSGNEFNGYPCIGDCSGHEAGYQWAEEKGITDEYDCSTPSNSFNEGCQSYVQEQQ